MKLTMPDRAPHRCRHPHRQAARFNAACAAGLYAAGGAQPLPLRTDDGLELPIRPHLAAPSGETLRHLALAGGGDRIPPASKRKPWPLWYTCATSGPAGRSLRQASGGSSGSARSPARKTRCTPPALPALRRRSGSPSPDPW